MRRAWLILALVAACGGSGANTTTEADETGATTTSTTEAPVTTTAAPTTTTTTEPPTTTTEASELGTTRDNPISVGQPALIGDEWEIAVVSVEADGTAAVMAENQFNDPPEEGSQFALVRLSFTYIGPETGLPWVDLSWAGIGASNVTVEDDCGVIPEDAFNVPEMFTGGSAEANICLAAPTSDIPGLLLILDPSFSFEDGTRRFYDLGL